jgi:hypothetical protein
MALTHQVSAGDDERVRVVQRVDRRMGALIAAVEPREPAPAAVIPRALGHTHGRGALPEWSEESEGVRWFRCDSTRDELQGMRDDTLRQ